MMMVIGQDDENLKIIDRYSDDGQDDTNLSVIDEYNDDGQDDRDLKVIDKYDHQKYKKTYNYKQLYENCLKSSRKMRKRIKNIQDMNDKRYRELRVASKAAQKQQKLKFYQEISALNEKCDIKINVVENKCEEYIEKIINKHESEHKQLETESEEKIKKLTDHIKSLEEDDENIDSLTKVIFNCTSMQEIFEIMHLVKNHQIDQVVQRHLKTLQNLFLSLSFGVLPICQLQREKIFNAQRELVQKISSASQSRAKGILKEHRNEVTNLFEIIEDSIKLARNSYNKYGTDGI